MKQRWQQIRYQMTPRLLMVLVSLVVALLVGSVSFAQSDGLRMSMWTLGSGGGRSTGGDFALVGTAGQISAGTTPAAGQESGQTFRVKGGFWPAMPGPATTPAPTTQSSTVYLAAIANQPSAPTVTPAPPRWQALGGQGVNFQSLAAHNAQIFAGAGNPGSGLYRKQLTSCAPNSPVERIGSVNADLVLGISFLNQQGVVATYDKGLFMSSNNGDSWQRTGANVVRPRPVALAPGNIFYVGTEDKGIYTSSDGATWSLRTSKPNLINTLKFNAASLWIGAEDSGTWLFTFADPNPVQRQDGLADNSLDVWDLAFSGATIYAATGNGVFRGDGTNRWESFGLSSIRVFSVEIANDQIFAGTNGQGVWKRPLASGDWTRVTSAGWNESATVRDLLYDSAYCQGLLAATNDGLWVYR